MLQRKIVHIDMDAFYASVATVIDNQYLGDRASEVAKIVRQESKRKIYSRAHAVDHEDAIFVDRDLR